MYTLEDSIQKFKPAITLTRFLDRHTLSSLRTSFFIATIASGSAAYGISSVYGTLTTELYGLSMIFGALWLEQVLTYSYHNSFYFYGLNSIIGIDEESTAGATYDVSEAVLKERHDVTLAFCNSLFGELTLLRAGVTPQTVQEFLQSPRQKITAAMVALPEDEMFSLIGLGKYLLQHDIGFRNMFRDVGISEDIYLGALRWVIGTYHQEKRLMRWWGKDNLSRTKGLGREWSYGVAYLLERFSRNINTSAVFSTLTSNSPFAEEKIKEIETTLARAKSANVMIVGEAGVGKMDLILEVQERMRSGKSLDAIAGQTMIVLDTNRLFAAHGDKQSFEVTFFALFDEAVRAGNLIIVIENISTFIREAEALGVYIPEIIDQYLSHPQLHIIATDTPGNYHTYLETLGAFVRRFSEILIDSPDQSATTRVLQGIALQNEARYNTLFTFAGLQAITTAADRYITEGVMPDKAVSLLVDIATIAAQREVRLINNDFVYQIVSEKTGIPAGPIQDTERDLLLHLEDRLHKRVIGQQQALNAISRTMRRARAGIQASDKPIGSFLFLGPTGVGKTETAKALALIFFGAETKLQRIDMSEFSGVDALEKIIGTTESSGILPDILREHPYCVLLLDEFEKAAKPVHDLFLQVLDEGIFTDARGNKVNARNTIIIATSNAGSALIMKTVEQRKKLGILAQEIIDHIVHEGIYRPELINRFDSTIIFEPLTIGEQTQVASLMLGGLYERIKGQGYEVSITNDLLTLLVEKGYNPEYGARPMQRVLQDVIEEKVAQKIISGALQKGDTIVLSKDDFTEAELTVQGT